MMTPPAHDKKHRRRADYTFFLSYRTRWSDNDQYAHVNNAVYYHLFDAIVNTYLTHHCGLAPKDASDGDQRHQQHRQIGLVVSSFCEFFFPLSFPDVVDLGLRVARLGRSSVTYEVGVFKSPEDDAASQGYDTPAAVGGYTHVFVDKHTRTSAAINEHTRAGLEKLIATPSPRTKL